jgi:hypothetical protein
VFSDSTAASVPNGSVHSWSVACPTGKHPVSGGFEPLPLLNTTTGSVFLTPIQSMAVSNETSSGWVVTLRNGSGTTRSGVQIRVWAACAVITY